MCSGMLRIGDGRSVWWNFRMGLECVAARLVAFFLLLCLFALCCLLSNCEIGGFKFDWGLLVTGCIITFATQGTEIDFFVSRSVSRLASIDLPLSYLFLFGDSARAGLDSFADRSAG